MVVVRGQVQPSGWTCPRIVFLLTKKDGTPIRNDNATFYYDGEELGTGKQAVVEKLREEVDILLAIENDVRYALKQGSATLQNGSDSSNGGSTNDSTASDD